MRFVFSLIHEWHQEQTSHSCSIVLQHSLHDAFHQMEWYAKAGRQTKPSSYQRSHNRLDGGRFANRKRKPHAHTHSRKCEQTNKSDTLYIQFTSWSSSIKQINKGVQSVSTFCWGRKRMGRRGREKNSGKDSENRSRGQKTLPPPLSASQISICGDEWHIYFSIKVVYM